MRAAVSMLVTANSHSERCIALLKPVAAADERVNHAFQLLDSILWAFQGTTRSTWKITSPEAAHIVVVSADDRDERISAWRAGGKIVVDIATEGLADPAVQNRLIYPFRAQQVLVLLERLDALLSPAADSGGMDGSGRVTARTEEPADPWSFVESLRTLRSVQNSQTWLLARDGRTPLLWLRGDAAAYAADGATVQSIRRGSLRLGSVTLQKGTDPGGAVTQRSGMELSWFAGYHASAQLAPSLRADTRYRITLWPDFGLIRPMPSQLRVAAGLSSAPANLDEIVARAKVSPEEATRTLSALYACDALIAVEASQSTASAVARNVAQPRGGFTSFLRNVRKHLGLGV